MDKMIFKDYHFIYKNGNACIKKNNQKNYSSPGTPDMINLILFYKTTNVFCVPFDLNKCQISMF